MILKSTAKTGAREALERKIFLLFMKYKMTLILSESDTSYGNSLAFLTAHL
ncbi:hypothetical protein [Paenibacillus endoradicis]|uniref:hypothetical protein n=1 Tax=Paenibacillus endoradicis TaxID=2972487 RepID=UPI002159B3DA|nr:hypothetical protein [Paenibacillus endoradicis]MCR8660581.1 hypothetical protein [Paenibacillus endoradicis]